jgi:hypothetical protein
MASSFYRRRLRFVAIMASHAVMTADAIRKELHKIPFIPFNLEVVGGEKYVVHHPDFVAISPTGRTLAIYTEGDASEVLDIALIAQIHRGASAA